MRIDPRHDRAALRLADGRWTDERIAAEANVTRVTLWAWGKDPDFAARVEAHRATLHAAIVKRGIADKQRRIAGQVERHQLMEQVLEARAARGRTQLEAYESGKTPGGLPRPDGEEWAKLDRVPAEVVTGLIVRQEKSTPFGTTVEWVVDTGLTAEMRATEKQVAQELGEWTEKRELSGKDGAPLQVIVFESSVPGLQPADIARADAQLAALVAAGESNDSNISPASDNAPPLSSQSNPEAIPFS